MRSFFWKFTLCLLPCLLFVGKRLLQFRRAFPNTFRQRSVELTDLHGAAVHKQERHREHGKRSGNFYMLPPGPRNPVGVMWIALNKKGIGMHGTDDPGSIGRAVSHGCIRLANWDVVRLATKIKAGDNVSIH